MDCVENTPPLGSFNTFISLDEVTKRPAPPQEISQTHFQFEGFHYVHHSKPKFDEKSEAWIRYYQCKHYRPPNSCKATLIVKCTCTENVSMKASIVQHTCLTVKAVQVGGIEDVTQLMSEEISAKAVEQSTTTAPKLAQQIRAQYEEIHKGKPVLMLDLPKSLKELCTVLAQKLFRIGSQRLNVFTWPFATHWIQTQNYFFDLWLMWS